MQAKKITTTTTEEPKNTIGEFEGFPIKLAFLHQTIMVPGFVNSERTLNTTKVPGAKMIWAPQGLILHVKRGTKTITTIIPSANVANAVIDE